MANIAATTMTGTNGAVTITRTTLTASDVLVNPNGILELYNTTASPVTVTIDGSGATTISPPGYGGTVDISAGKAIVVPASGTVAINLSTISAFLAGTIAVTGGTGVVAQQYII